MFLTLFPYLALALNLLLLLGLFFGVNRTLWKLRSRLSKCEAKVESAALQVTEGIKDVNRRMSELAEVDAAEQNGLPGTLGDSLNATLRGKALKMHRMGQSMDRIAETLRVPRGEIELLIKVHQVVMRPYENGQTSLQTPLAG